MIKSRSGLIETFSVLAVHPVFKSILQIDSNNSNPVIYLRGIQHSEMESIMQFIYLGEGRFYEERMSEILMVSKNIEIKDLSTGIEIKADQTKSNEECSDIEISFILFSLLTD